jgi:hypothetical protein
MPHPGCGAGRPAPRETENRNTASFRFSHFSGKDPAGAGALHRLLPLFLSRQIRFVRKQFR